MEALFNSPDLGDLKAGVAPFFNDVLGVFVSACGENWPRRDKNQRRRAAGG
jgi:hypothetical protein